MEARGIRSPGVGVTDLCELPDMDARNWPWILCKDGMPLQPLPISLRVEFSSSHLTFARRDSALHLPFPQTQQGNVTHRKQVASMEAHTYIHTCIHAYTHAHTHTGTHIYIHSQIYSDIHTTHLSIQTYMYIHIYNNTILPHIHAYTHTYPTYIHSPTHIHANILSTCTHTYMHVHTYT
jgi:hypothetical protein